ncbi:CCR4-NOT transcription complex subunit 3 [Schistosoma japonicum]|uniref:CCR4-NOT transcription complex subunit 3 n=1 Tax=Schistosoma japonicum TaxID=6182 RepID=A0A4Z2D3J0_SCHJA|nr:CCR4-NOT transcription complex subunit 3 [Schistosoma japonicum]KAH8861560.1 CCR4-NOT transcription complex subunit 3 [Schistosoma japonicum]TNN10729.1 CCR4-NOT transcription complex subunit 3 [Schistosoma japonicum]TNN10730.1 CCR4-NOT transcription complex subunit 3 [Schistosoma japonicum]
MERFKVIEKETKTKAYSKEGLLSTEAKKDPLQKEKEELDEWLKQCISSLNTQTEKYEFEIESLSNNTKKKRIDKETASAIDEKRQRLEMCCFHVEKLEAIMRLLDNERLDCTKVRSIQESIEYVIDSGDNQSMFDFKNIYDDLCLDELGDSTIITPTSGTVTGNQENDLNGVITTGSTLVNQRGGSDDAGSSTSTQTSVSNHTDSSATHPGSSASSNASSSRERAKSDDKVSLLPHVSASSTSTPMKSSGGSPGKHKSTASVNQTAPALMSQVVAGTPNKSSGKLNANSHPVTNNVGTVTESTLTKPCTTSDSQVIVDDISRSQKNDINQKHNDRSNVVTASPQLQSQVKNAPSDDINSLSPISSISATNPISTAPSLVFTAPHLKEDPSVINNQDEILTQSQPTCIPNSVDASSPLPHRCKTSEVSKTSGVTSVYNNTILPTSTDEIFENVNHTPPSLYSAAMLAASQDKQLASLITCSQHSSLRLTGSNIVMDPSVATISLSNKFHSTSSVSSLPLPSTVVPTTNPQIQPSYLALDNQLPSIQTSLHSQQMKNQSSPVHAHMHPRDVAAPFRNRNLDKPKGAIPQELLLQLQALESGYRRLPHSCDTEKSRMIICKNSVNCPSYYPREPLIGTENEEYYMKLDAQTLFFIFYYFEGTKAQYYAAKALKRMSWRFHTKFMMWFQRHEEPKQITDEYESGSYIYYDFRTMRQRKKEEFMFHYSFLEDKDF